MSIDIIIHIMAMMHKVNYFNSFEKKLKSVGKKLNKKDLLIINLKELKKWELKKMNQKSKFWPI